jgi:hypothetical protein
MRPVAMSGDGGVPDGQAQNDRDPGKLRVFRSIGERPQVHGPPQPTPEPLPNSAIPRAKSENQPLIRSSTPAPRASLLTQYP